MGAAGVDDVLQASDVDLVEVRGSSSPDADERGSMTDRVDASRGALNGVTIAHVAVDWFDELVSRRVRAGRSGEDDAAVAGGEERADERAAEVSGAAGNEDFHRAVCGRCQVPSSAGGRSLE